MFARLSKLEKERRRALSYARTVRASFGDMISRCMAAGETPDLRIISDFESAMAQCEQRMKEETDVDEFEALEYLAAAHGQLSAYLCPLSEIHDEGAALIDLMQDWGFSDVSLARYKAILDTKCRDPKSHPEAARGALHSIMHEVDACEDYLENFEDDVRRLSWILLAAVIVSFLAGLVALSFSSRMSILLPFSLFVAGGTGSCVSVLARMPISKVSSSAVSASMERRILIRVGTGMIASVVGCSLLAWGVLPLQINNVSFSNAVSACDSSSAGNCATVYSLILLAVPIMFGFSERILTTLEDKLLGAVSSRQ